MSWCLVGSEMCIRDRIKDAISKAEKTSEARMSGLMPAGMKMPF
jgi:hypothetical protein